MSRVVPLPDPEDRAFNEPVTVMLDPGEQATVTFETVQNAGRFHLPILAISKHPDTSYRVELDGETWYGPADIPPTDVDDLQVCFLPALTFRRTLTAVVVNLSGSVTRQYSIQPVGWEVVAGAR